MGEDSRTSRTRKPITHGICHSCAADLWGETGTRLDDFLNSLGVPTLLIDPRLRVHRTNRELRALVGKTEGQVEGQFNGEVFDCWNATLPGGCGHTVECSACVVRKTVLDTYNSGDGHQQVPVVLKIRENGVGKDFEFVLTTEKAGETVVVQLRPRGGPSPDEGALP